MADRKRPGGGGGQDPGQDENVPQRHAMVSSRRPTCPLASHLPEVRPLGRHVATLQSPQPDSRITQTQRRRKEITPEEGRSFFNWTCSSISSASTSFF